MKKNWKDFEEREVEDKIETSFRQRIGSINQMFMDGA
jgi:hypothetical protein